MDLNKRIGHYCVTTYYAGGHYVKLCTITVDAIIVKTTKGEGYRVLRELDKNIAATVKTLDAERTQFRFVTFDAITKVIKCYDQMCRLIGESYTPPINVADSGLPHIPPFIDTPIRMPGALIKHLSL